MLALTMSAAVVSIISCDNDQKKAKLYDLSVTVTLNDELAEEGVEFADLSEVTISLVDIASGAITKSDAEGETTVLKVKGGDYNVVVSAKIAVEGETPVMCNGSVSNIACYGPATANVELAKAGNSGLVIKEIYFCGVMSYYHNDGFVEIYNNSDQVQYLDGIILSYGQQPAITTTPTANQWADDAVLGDRYALDGPVVYFPGDGDDYPLEPWTSTVVAATAINHAGRELSKEEGKEDVASPVDLSNADWEISLGESGLQASDTDTPNVPNLTFGYWPKGYADFYPTNRSGQAFIMARPVLAEGQTFQNFIDNAENKVIIPGYRAYPEMFLGMMGAYLLAIPQSWVVDAIDIVMAPEANRVKVLNTKDDMGMVWVNGEAEEGSEEAFVAGQYCGKSLRRKVAALTAEGNPIYKDTNNSSEDFAMGGATPTPGVHPTTVD